MSVARKFGNRYPWRNWFGKKRMVLVRGTHYHCLSHGMAGMVRNTARRYGVTVSVSVADNSVTFEVV